MKIDVQRVLSVLAFRPNRASSRQFLISPISAREQQSSFHDSPPAPNMAASSSPYVTLISNDGFEFIIRREAACVAGTIKKMLDPQSACTLPLLSHSMSMPMLSFILRGLQY